jgi:hypothetical protein
MSWWGIRSARRKDGRGIGMQSSGLLLAFLHWETHRRADSPQDAVWLMSDVREALYRYRVAEPSSHDTADSQQAHYCPWCAPVSRSEPSE